VAHTYSIFGNHGHGDVLVNWITTTASHLLALRALINLVCTCSLTTPIRNYTDDAIRQGQRNAGQPAHGGHILGNLGLPLPGDALQPAYDRSWIYLRDSGELAACECLRTADETPSATDVVLLLPECAASCPQSLKTINTVFETTSAC
jgi:hypothetical protein